jgi:hypothetical protein
VENARFDNSLAIEVQKYGKCPWFTEKQRGEEKWWEEQIKEDRVFENGQTG